MRITLALVRAYDDQYSEAEIRAFRTQAMAAVAADLGRVEITSSSMGDASSGGQYIEGDPAGLVDLFQAVLDYKAAGTEYDVNASMTHGDFSQRAIGW